MFQVLAVLYNTGRSLSEKREVVSFEANWDRLLSQSANKGIFYFKKAAEAIFISIPIYSLDHVKTQIKDMNTD